jgi:hypothetical protein
VSSTKNRPDADLLDVQATKIPERSDARI